MARAVVGRDMGDRSVSKVERKRPVEAIVIDAIWLIVGIIDILLALKVRAAALGRECERGIHAIHL